ncbi:phosphatidylserine synthase, putative [Plasmodium sp. gorilla clade G2]|uniref:phosphatidylserine synthase, putative n=1 Tax=Plasmodium sp. gorilla clade G2 TaxID=880535 RepID=UPI000D20B321|nr:phosphatidylserine synthase, putative [Plasmodium sp. gorilla clade G2]SOV18487.1 phosphatidylserine synthase, putative [Plasmodium sp. gorilla clade G2]
MKSIYLFASSLLASLLLSSANVVLDFNTRIIISLVMLFFNFITLFNVMQKYAMIPKISILTKILNYAILIYYVIIIYLHFFSSSEVQTILRFLNKNIEFHAVEKSYMENCNTIENVSDKIDWFVLAHLWGWFAKGMIIRNFFLLNINSALFELVELRFQHILPNFYECWWDHIFLDVLSCNLIGIAASILFMKYFNITLYDWKIPDKIKLNKKNIILPTVDKLCRKIFTNSSTLLLLIFLSFIINIIDLNIFFLKAEVKLHHVNLIVLVRTFAIGFISGKACKEFYWFLKDGMTPKRAFYIFLELIILSLELILAIRWKDTLVSDKSDLTAINMVWLFITSTLSSVLLLLYVNESLI